MKTKTKKVRPSKTNTQKCPLCAETISLTATVCKYCGAQFEVHSAGYCSNCHRVRQVSEDGGCIVCGGELIDLSIKSKMNDQSAAQPDVKMVARPSNRKALLWAGAGILVVAAIAVAVVFLPPILGASSDVRILSPYATSLEILSADPMDKNLGWSLGCNSLYRDGALVINGADWCEVQNHTIIKNGQGIIVDLTFSPDKPEFSAFLHNGTWDNPSYVEYGFQTTSYGFMVNICLGENGYKCYQYAFASSFANRLTMEAGKTYSYAVMADEGGRFVAVIWDKADPSKIISYDKILGFKWERESWHFAIAINRGKVTLDNFRIVSFENIQ